MKYFNLELTELNNKFWHSISDSVKDFAYKLVEVSVFELNADNPNINFFSRIL
jgi:hypothetical protein